METTEIRGLIGRLEASLGQTVELVEQLPESYVDAACGHACARGGTVWDLLTHNIEHERMHAGQIAGVRDSLRKLQQDRRSRLLAELYVERARLIASLFGLDDEDLERVPKEGEWSLREVVDHVLYWERDSMATLSAEFEASRASG